MPNGTTHENPYGSQGPTTLPPQLTVAQLERLALHPDKRVRQGVVRHKSVSKRILMFLSRDVDIEVRSDVARRPDAPCFALMLLSRDESPYIRLLVAAHRRTPSDAFDHLVDVAELDTRKQAASHPAVRVPALMRLAMTNINVVEFLNRDELPSEIFPILAGRADDYGLRVLGCDLRTPVELILGYIGRLSLLSLHVVAIRRRRDLEPFLSLSLIERIEEARKEALRCAEDAMTTPETLSILSHTNDTDVLALVAAHPATDLRSLLRICGNYAMALIVLKRPHIHEDVADRIMGMQTEHLQEALVKHPECPHEVLHDVGLFGFPKARIALARRADLPLKAILDVLTFMTMSDTSDVQLAMAQNRAMPPHLLSHLAKSHTRAVARAAKATLHALSDSC